MGLPPGLWGRHISPHPELQLPAIVTQIALALFLQKPKGITSGDEVRALLIACSLHWPTCGCLGKTCPFLGIDPISISDPAWEAGAVSLRDPMERLPSSVSPKSHSVISALHATPDCTITNGYGVPAVCRQ